MEALSTGSIIGILGGGQLGRMTAMAAARLGYRCHIFCPDPNEPAVEVAAFHTQGSFTDEAALTRFAKSVDVVTLEWENVPLAALESIGRYTRVYPGVDVLRIAQDRGLEKGFARAAGIGTADYALVSSAEEVAEALETFDGGAILKSTRMGYDGKGQVRIAPGMDAQTAWAAMGGSAGILESLVDFDCEISAIVARREDDAMAVFPVVENIHRNQILAETLAPARVDQAIAQEATLLARTMARRLKVVGLLAVEMFVLRHPNAHGQRVLMNEIAPRPHNSGHWTMDACACSQFEMLVRAVCGLPLFDPMPHSKAVMRNLLGDDVSQAPEILADPSACLHLYGKKEARAGRKMGHVTYLKGAW